jgi:CRISPR-associated endonuclease/helicase Cas3
MTDRLLAKSPLGGRHVTLPAHAAAVRETASTLFGSAQAPTRLGREWLRFFKLDDAWFAPFVTNVALAAVFHDIGKANDGFQREVRGQKGCQAIRHEHLSALLLCIPAMRQWLVDDPIVDFEIVVSAVVSHHLKVKEGMAPPGHEFASRIRDVAGFRVFINATDFLEVLRIASDVLGISPTALPDSYGVWSFDAGEPAVGTEAERFRAEFGRFARALRHDERRRRCLLAVRAALIAADAAGSALVRVDAQLSTWLQHAFGEPLRMLDIDEKVVEPRIAQIRRTRGTFDWHAFQVAAETLGPRAVLLAGCGSGKTLAAWRWIRAQLACRPAGRVIFLYPTRGTATEGFRDYVSWAGTEEAALVHGTAAYTLEGLFANPEDSADPRHSHDYRVDPRLFALGYWPRRILSATVDSFLAFMSHDYVPLCLLPLLADSVLVVDEVHSFDRAMFKALVRFLEFFDLPVLCMTASLTRDRLAALESVGLKRFPEDPTQFGDLRAQSEHARYAVRRVTAEEAEDVVLRTLAAGEPKILWVFNTVARCQEAAGRLRARIPAHVDLLCYHSRFRLMDRATRHEEVIARFRRTEWRPVLLLSTQVCEMSLDLDADVLVSEVAPVSSVIQRMGRCCRESMPRPGRIGQILLYSPESHRPYEREEAEQGEAFLRWAEGRSLSQADLAQYLDEMVVDPVVVDGYTSFLGSGWWAWSREEAFREADEYTFDAVLDTDIREFLAAREARRPADGWVVPVPRRHTLRDERLGFLRRAPASHYDRDLGFLDREVGDGRGLP